MRTNPKDAEALYSLARSLGALGKWQEALGPAEKALALDGRNAAYHHFMGEVAGQLAIRTAIYKQLGWARRARKEFETAYQSDASNTANLFSLANYLWQAPGLLGGDRKRARELVESMKKIDACKGHMTEAFLHGVSKNPLAELTALQAGPHCYETRTALAAYYVQPSHRDWRLVARHAADAIAIDGTRARAYGLLAQSLAAEGKLAELSAVLKQAEAAVPDDLRPYLMASQNLNDKKLADQYLKKYRSQEAEGLPPALQPGR